MGEVETSVKCPVCHGVLDNPLCTPCGHVFCTSCVLPWVVQYQECPVKCGTTLQAGDLRSKLELRDEILTMDVKCDFCERGCAMDIKLADLAEHVLECDYRPMVCRNKGCDETLNNEDLLKHEAEDCEYRPVGVCQDGCELVLIKHSAHEHNCVEALKLHMGSQDLKLSALEHEMKKLASKSNKREKSLLAQINSLHSEIQMQALKFQRKLTEYRTQIQYLSKRSQLQKVRPDDPVGSAHH